MWFKDEHQPRHFMFSKTLFSCEESLRRKSAKTTPPERLVLHYVATYPSDFSQKAALSLAAHSTPCAHCWCIFTGRLHGSHFRGNANKVSNSYNDF